MAAEAAADVRALRSLGGYGGHGGSVGRRVGEHPRAHGRLSRRRREARAAHGGLEPARPAGRPRWHSCSEAVERLRHQSRVLDDWGFLAGRPGARGVRMLFAGPPGTGKTLSAEVLAHELGVDLLVVDISRVVSKWIGETEKNLAEVFDAAERAQAVLLFDEADALFGKRTRGLRRARPLREPRDRVPAGAPRALRRARGAGDQPAAERRPRVHRGGSSSSSTSRSRRPSSARRSGGAIFPSGAPLDGDVDLARLAALYPVVGGRDPECRDRSRVPRGRQKASRSGARTWADALRREYEKAGKAFPGEPTDAYPAGRTHG